MDTLETIKVLSVSMRACQTILHDDYGQKVFLRLSQSTGRLQIIATHAEENGPE